MKFLKEENSQIGMAPDIFDIIGGIADNMMEEDSIPWWNWEILLTDVKGLSGISIWAFMKNGAKMGHP